MEFRSSYLSENGTLLNLIWNDTSLSNLINTKTKDVHESMEIDDAAWVMSSTFMIFGKFLFCKIYLSTEEEEQCEN
jgi:hypothetical protein